MSLETTPAGLEVATLGGGCFWCLEAVFDSLQGVVAVESGYTGGKNANPTYQQVCNGNTGHAEVVRVTFDPKAIGFRDVLDVFFTIHDPTTLNRQGNDVGTQYRSAVFYHSPGQKEIAEKTIAELAAAKAYPDKIVTEVVLMLATLGRAPVVTELKQRLERVANLKSPVLMVGEPGSGVELCARFIHQPSTLPGRPSAPWVEPENLAVLAEAPLELLRLPQQPRLAPYEVDRRVNSVRNNGPDLLAPVGPAEPDTLF